MISDNEACFIAICLETFFHGLYSGIFVLYLQHPPDRSSRRPIIVFYVLCLLYVLSTATVVIDLLSLILGLQINTLSLQLQIETQAMLFRLSIAQITASGCCDFIAQCIMIYRCWIVWGQNTRVIIIPSFLAITYLATWLASTGSTTLEQGRYVNAAWENPVALTGFVASMAVNTLVTGLIVFKIINFKVFLTSVERTLGSTRGTTFRHTIFIIIESGMALFAVQLVRVVLSYLPMQLPNTVDLAIGINQMIIGIAPTIILVRVSMKLSFDDKESFMEAVGSLCFNNTPSDPNTSTLQRMGGSNMIPPQERSMPPQEKGEDIFSNNPPSDDTDVVLRRMRSSSSSSSSSMPPQVWDEDRILVIGSI